MYRPTLFGALLIGLSLQAALSGCTSGRNAQAGKEEVPEMRIKAEAFLFDAQLRRQSKPTSVRLELYHTDSLTGVSGRGYLGKGALKGWMSDDSLEVYFPSTNEYVYDALPTILASDSCPGRLPQLPLGRLLVTTPDSIGALGDVVLEADYSDHDRPTFALSLPGCLWHIDATYDRSDDGWRVKQFFFDDGRGMTLKATRRTLKSGADVPASRFRAPIPPDALRLIP